jgi:hypothetical protein
MFSFHSARRAMMLAAIVFATFTCTTDSYSVTPKQTTAVHTVIPASPVDRRTAFKNFMGAAAGAGVLLSSSTPALASGGATAGKYTYVNQSVSGIEVFCCCVLMLSNAHTVLATAELFPLPRGKQKSSADEF